MPANGSSQPTKGEQAHANGHAQLRSDGAHGKDDDCRPGHQDGHAEEGVTELRQRWDELLAEAASSTDPKRQHELLPLVRLCLMTCWRCQHTGIHVQIYITAITATRTDGLNEWVSSVCRQSGASAGHMAVPALQLASQEGA